MARIGLKDTLGLPVYTESGTHLGKLIDVILDVESHMVVSYEVRTGSLAQQVLSQQDAVVSIQPQQVVGITAERMIVQDSAAAAMEGAPAVPQPVA